MKQITIIGGGWLGQPLAQCLENLGHKVSVSRTTVLGVKELTEKHLNGFEFDLNQDISVLTQSLKALSPDIVIGCFPPGFRKGKGDEYAHHWNKLTQICQQVGVARLVMVSSTTVYPNIAQEMREDQATLALAQSSVDFTDNAKVMLQAEQYLIDSGLGYGVVRCSGLIGPDRNPARFVSKLKQVSNQAPANMLHLHDAIGATCFVALNTANVVVNATTPNTVSKAEFYQAALEQSGSNDPLPPITATPDKRIVADRLIQLGYHFHFQHTLEML
ncbi:NAD(P)H-binding protein [Vibrio ouci]|uniref:NAD-dependent epimerase/dehydratase family protein n=1 Tax=Vibrio ouci TaxID=2499078 RepID=A0A4Y8WJQ8_9VIBR|nr:NAD(P)H-binding protein [Vibrio ouci]TFH92896.1 NAD-dependent epimerase/dehydratase family protein [Vibrio ouci]